MAERWRYGTPPKDGRPYEVKQRYKFAGHWHTAQHFDAVFWNGQIFVRISAFHGKQEGVVLINRWRPRRWLSVSANTSTTTFKITT